MKRRNHTDFEFRSTRDTATRPLAVNVLGDQVYFPTVDLTKNVCELVDFYGDIAATYDYAPFGGVTAGTPSGAAAPANPFQFSSEFYDSELDLVYYNYRHYSPADGRFLSRDLIEEQGGWNLYAFVNNGPIVRVDLLGGFLHPPILGSKPRKEVVEQIIKDGYKICEGYPGVSKCCREGRLVDDPYQGKVKGICKGFVRDYADADNRLLMLCVARCLVESENIIAKKKDCAERNVDRLVAHVGCYTRCGFIPYRGFPEGGTEVGWGMLLPDLLKRNQGKGIGYDSEGRKIW